MRRIIAAMLFIIMLCHALPMQAMATVGRVLSKEERARAYALTGLGTGGLAAVRDGAYHGGMKPNAGWNASQIDDWLEEKLSRDLATVNELLSQAAYTLEQMKNRDPEAYHPAFGKRSAALCRQDLRRDPTPRQNRHL